MAISDFLNTEIDKTTIITSIIKYGHGAYVDYERFKVATARYGAQLYRCLKTLRGRRVGVYRCFFCIKRLDNKTIMFQSVSKW